MFLQDTSDHSESRLSQQFLSFEPTSAVNAYSMSGIGTRVSDTIALSQLYQQYTPTCGWPQLYA
jgi:hypothetical protein